MVKKSWLAAALVAAVLSLAACATDPDEVTPSPGIRTGFGEEKLVISYGGHAVGEMFFTREEAKGHKLVADLAIMPISLCGTGLTTPLVKWELRVGFYDVTPGKTIEKAVFGTNPVRVRILCPEGQSYGTENVYIGMGPGRWINAAEAVAPPAEGETKDKSGLELISATNVPDSEGKRNVAVELVFARWPAGDPPITWGKPPGT